MASSSNSFSCPLCSANFSRKEHLKRHITSHSPDQPFQCGHCGKSYRRRDVLKRHYSTCSWRPGNAYARGTDGAASTSSTPQETFLSGSNQAQSWHPPRESLGKALEIPPASILDIVASMDHRGMGSQPAIDSSYLSSRGSICSPNPQIISISIPNEKFIFLSRSMKNPDLEHVFEPGTRAQRVQFMKLFVPIYEFQTKEILQAQLNALPSTFDIEFDRDSGQGANVDTLPLIGTHPITIRSHEIVRQIKMLASSKRKLLKQEWSEVLQYRCYEFFSPNNIAKFIDFYWVSIHPNVPVIHKPTFDIMRAPYYLLCVMMLKAACVSPSEADRTSSYMWFDVIEEMIFEHDDLQLMQSGYQDHDVAAMKKQVTALQAALLVALLQIWGGGSQLSQRRIRRSRFGTIISLLRDTGFSRARHSENITEVMLLDFDWEEFVVREEAIRVCLSCYLLECGFTIFNKTPPRMLPTELVLDFCCPEPIFGAMTADECYWLITVWEMKMMRKWPVAQAVEYLCQHNVAPDVLEMLSILAPFNLHVLMCSLHLVIFNIRNSLGYAIPYVAMEKSMENWLKIWIRHNNLTPDENIYVWPEIALTPENMWRRKGFTNFTNEYWMLARLMLTNLAKNHKARLQEAVTGSIITSMHASTQPENLDQSDMAQTKALVLEHRTQSP